jgi:tetratricopeptide (TPR) repeat protein
MAESLNSEFSKLEIDTQVGLIIVSDLFGGERNRLKPTRPAEVLRYIVDRALAGEPVTHHHILADVYKFEGDTTKKADSKVALKKLRSQLKAYYEGSGCNDPILIEIPKKQCEALFIRRGASEAQREVERGTFHANRESPTHSSKALEHFNKAIELNSTLAEAHSGKAGALQTAIFHDIHCKPLERLNQSETAAREALRLNERTWTASLELAAVYLFRLEWAKADQAFAKAMGMNPVGAENHGSLGVYYLCRGKYQEALRLADFYRRAYPTNPVLLGRAALYLYTLRRFHEVVQLSTEIFDLGSPLWLNHMTLVYTNLAIDEPVKALEHLRHATALSRSNLWPGLRILCLVRADEMHQANLEFDKLKLESSKGYIRPFQLAIAHMALDQPKAAIEFLTEACQECDPFASFIHLWPYFDSLRSHSAFTDLLKRKRFVEPPNH